MEAANIHWVVRPSFSTLCLPELFSWFPVKWNEIIPDDPFHMQRILWEGGGTCLNSLNEPGRIQTSPCEPAEVIQVTRVRPLLITDFRRTSSWVERTISPCWELLALTIVCGACFRCLLRQMLPFCRQSSGLRRSYRLRLNVTYLSVFGPSAEAESRWTCVYSQTRGNAGLHFDADG